LVGGIVPYDRAVKSANVFMDRLARKYGFLVSDATTPQQWDGSPDKKKKKKGEGEVGVNVDVFGEDDVIKGENRGWMSTIMLASESFFMAAMEAKANGDDPEPLLRAARVGLAAVQGIEEIAFPAFRHIREKVHVERPTDFVNGGEYGQTEEDVQKGFGMQIGAIRQLYGRDFDKEVGDPSGSWRRLTFARLFGNLAVPVPI
jgi:hypothetical protein